MKVFLTMAASPARTDPPRSKSQVVRPIKLKTGPIRNFLHFTIYHTIAFCFSIFFRFPVDPVRDGLPTYLDEIKQPMDLSTMEKKVNQAAYATMGEFAADMELIFANCRQFNPPGTEPCQHADELEKMWRKEWAKTVTPKLMAEFPAHLRAYEALAGR